MNKLEKKIFIIGKVPPPIGGVTIHVKRLLDILDQKEIEYTFISLTKKTILNYMIKTNKNTIIHLHTSSPFIRFMFSFFNKFKKSNILLNTYHGNLGRFGILKNWMDKFSIKHSTIPIVLNNESFSIAKDINSRTRQISAFIPPNLEEPLSNKINKLIVNLKKEKPLVFCTNASNLSFDRNKQEIYYGTFLVKLFCKDENQKFGFIFSDPSGNYKKHFESIKLKPTNNIIIISKPHSFYNILKLSDCFIRATTTDGDPLSVKEALFLKKIVFASNVIERPNEVFTFTLNTSELQHLINNINALFVNTSKEELGNSTEKIIELYAECTELAGLD